MMRRRYARTRPLLGTAAPQGHLSTKPEPAWVSHHSAQVGQARLAAGRGRRCFSAPGEGVRALSRVTCPLTPPLSPMGRGSRLSARRIRPLNGLMIVAGDAHGLGDLL